MTMNLKIVCLTLVLFAVDAERVVPAQDFYWRDYVHGTIPPDALEGKPGIYIGQACYNGIVPAAIYPYRNTAVAMDGTKKYIKENIKILCAYNRRKFYWERVDFKLNNLKQMLNAVKGGFQNDQDLFVGAIWHDNDWKIGKVVDLARDSDKGLYVWDNNGNQARVSAFELLKYNSTVSNDHPDRPPYV